MSTTINFSVLDEFLSETISSKDVAQTLDDIMLDYVQTTFESHEAGMPIHSKMSDFVWLLRELRDIFRGCESEPEPEPES